MSSGLLTNAVCIFEGIAEVGGGDGKDGGATASAVGTGDAELVPVVATAARAAQAVVVVRVGVQAKASTAREGGSQHVEGGWCGGVVRSLEPREATAGVENSTLEGRRGGLKELWVPERVIVEPQ